MAQFQGASEPMTNIAPTGLAAVRVDNVQWYRDAKNPALKKVELSQGVTALKVDKIAKQEDHNRSNEFIPLKTTEDQLKENVIGYIKTLDLDVPPSVAKPTKLDSDQRAFITAFKKMYPDYKDNLDQAVTKFLQTEEGFTAAIKIIEWELATIQKATGAYIEGIQLHDPTYTPIKNISIAGSQPSVRPGRLGGIMHMAGEGFAQYIFPIDYFPIIGDTATIPQFDILGRRIWNSFDIPGGMLLSPAQVAKVRLQRARYHRKVNQKDTNYETKVAFMEKDELKYDFTGLTEGQKAYLERKGITDGMTLVDEPDAKPPRRDASVAMTELADEINLLTNARVDFYQGMGRENMGKYLNMIKEPTIGGAIEYVDITDFQTPILRVEKRTDRTGAATIETILTKELKTVTKDIRKYSNERLKNEREASEDTGVANSAKNQKTELDQQITLTPDKQKRKNELPGLTEKLGNRLKTVDKPSELQDEINSLTAKIGTIEHDINTIQGGLVDSFSKLKDKEDKLARLIEDKKDLVAERIQWASQQKPTAAILGRVKDIDDFLQSAYQGGDALNKQITDLQDEINQIKRLTDTGTQGKSLIDELQHLRDTLGNISKEKNLADREVIDLFNKVNKDRLAMTPPLVAYINIAEMKTGMGDDIKKFKTEEKELAFASEDVERDRKKQAINTFIACFIDGTDPDDLNPDATKRRNKRAGILARAAEMHRFKSGKTPMPHSADYDLHYDYNYLLIIRTLFGKDAVTAGSEQLFQDVIRVVTPEYVMRLYNSINSTGINDLSGLDPKNINMGFINKLLQSLRQDVLLGQLGTFMHVIDPAYMYAPAEGAIIKGHLEMIRLVDRDPNVPMIDNLGNPIDINALAGVFYHYEKVEDLARRILNRWQPSYMYDLYDITNAGNIKTIQQALRAAELIDQMRAWRKKLHPAPAQPTTT